MLRALGIFVTVTQLCEGFAPARSSVRSNGFAMRRRHALRAAEDGSEEVAYPFTSVDPKLEQTLMIRGHSSAVCSAQFGPDGQKIVSASDDSTVRVWSAKTAL